MGRGALTGQDAATLVATVGGLGRVPWAPGTWGSAVGLVIGVLLVRILPQTMWGPLLALSFAAAAVLCTHAERRLRQHDPPIVILDEVWGMAAVLLMLPWVSASRLWLLAAFLLFRLFDIVKPPPLKRLARWPGGWGIMADDLGAAGYTVLAIWLASRLFG